jgi:hypothetical protein
LEIKEEVEKIPTTLEIKKGSKKAWRSGNSVIKTKFDQSTPKLVQ